MPYKLNREALSKIAKKYLDSHSLSSTAAAGLNMSEPTLRAIIAQKDQNYRISTIIDICNATNTSIETIITK